jgi:hypothetical protein
MTEWPSGKTNSSYLRLDVLAADVAHVFEAGHVDLVVEVADVADDRLVLHPRHVLGGDDALVAGGGDEDVGGLEDVLERGDLVALHRRLQRADRVDLGDDHAAPWPAATARSPCPRRRSRRPPRPCRRSSRRWRG